MDGTIYLFINKINGKKYVGQTWNFQRRKREHLNANGKTKLLKNAIIKYGKDNFEIKTLYHTDKQELLDKVEILMISLLGTLIPLGYNISKGGFGKGKHSNETKQLIGSSGKNRVVSDETKKLIGSYHKDKIVSEETRTKISNALMGKSISKEVREKISIKLQENHLAKDKPVYFYDCFSHSLVKQFKNMAETRNHINFPIHRVFGSISTESKFKYNHIYCYASYSDKPSYKKYTIGRQIEVTDERGLNC